MKLRRSYNNSRETIRADRIRREEIGANIKRMRERAGLSRAQLAAACGRKASTITNIEIGQNRIKLADVLEIATALGVAPEVLSPMVAA